MPVYKSRATVGRGKIAKIKIECVAKVKDNLDYPTYAMDIADGFLNWFNDNYDAEAPIDSVSVEIKVPSQKVKK